MADPLFVFDGDCGFCRKWAAWLSRHTTSSVTFSPYQALDLDSLGLTAAEVQTASYWIDSSGRLFRGNRSFARGLRSGPWPWRLLGLVGDLPIVRSVLALVYRRVARNRHRLPAPDLLDPEWPSGHSS